MCTCMCMCMCVYPCVHVRECVCAHTRCSHALQRPVAGRSAASRARLRCSSFVHGLSHLGTRSSRTSWRRDRAELAEKQRLKEERVAAAAALKASKAAGAAAAAAAAGARVGGAFGGPPVSACVCVGGCVRGWLGCAHAPVCVCLTCCSKHLRTLSQCHTHDTPRNRTTGRACCSKAAARDLHSRQHQPRTSGGSSGGDSDSGGRRQLQDAWRPQGCDARRWR
jgi:hypothetical protein